MSTRISTGLRNAIVQGLGLSGALNKCSIEIYAGSQPANADAAVTGTLLGVATIGSGALTKETRATGSITITGGATSVATLTVGGMNIIPDGAVAWNTSTAQTASDLCDAINRNAIYTAVVSGAVVTLSPRPGVGAAHNTYVVTSTGSVTASYSNMASGVSPVNALKLAIPSAGVITKPPGDVWSFVGVANGTAGWYRIVNSATDAGGALVGAPWLARLDGSVATSGADLNLSNISIAVGAPNTIDTFSFTMSAQ